MATKDRSYYLKEIDMSYIPKNLTGNRRYRIGWRGKLILQVEQNVGFVEDCGGNFIGTEPGKIWRDAEVSDVTMELQS